MLSLPKHLVLFRELEKATDTKDFQLAIKQREIDCLQAELTLLKGKKKERVNVDPNCQLANIGPFGRRSWLQEPL